MKTLAILNLIISAQALFLSLHFILKSRGIRVLNRSLAFLCFSFAIISLNTYLNLAGLLLQYPLREDVSNNLIWFVGPVLYFYVIYNDRKPERRFMYLNTIPYAVLATVIVFSEWSWLSGIIMFVAFTQMIIYLFLSIKHSVNNFTESKQYYAWIMPSIIVFALLVAINFSISVLNVMGIKLVSNIISQSFTSLLVVPVFFLAYKEMNSKNDLGIAPTKYRASQISDEKAKRYLTLIESSMRDEKLYLEKDLTLKTFAQQLKINPRYISQVINQELQMSFTDYVFRYRFEDVKKRLTDSSNRNLTIFGIAQESGFKSNSRFNHLFKQHAGLTPKEFQKLHSK